MPRAPIAGRLSALLLVVALAGAALAAPGAAQSTQKLDEIARQHLETSKELAAATAQLEDLRAQQGKLEADLRDLDGKVAAAGQRLAEAQAIVDQLDAESAALAARVAETQAQLQAAQDDAKRSAISLYMRSDGHSKLEIMNGTIGSGQLVEAEKYLEHVSRKRVTDAQRAIKLKDQLGQQRTQLATKQQDAAGARDAVAAEKASADAALAQQQSAAANARNAAANTQSLAADLERRSAQEETEMQVESDRIAVALAGSGGGPSFGGNGRFLRPVNGPVTSTFGYRVDPVTGAQGSFHGGIDFGSSCGTPIKAGATGQVFSAGFNDGGFGNLVILQHGNGLASLYGHQSAVAVSPGQIVAVGQVIGYVGSTGKSTGCHLHFEVRVNGNPVDPAQYLP